MVTLSIQIRQASCTSLRHLINVSATIQLRKLLMHWKMRKLALMMNGVKEPSAKKKEAAPLCLKVTLQLIREGRFQSLDQCLAHEYCTSPTGISKRVSNDFCEGVRAQLVDKDFAPEICSSLILVLFHVIFLA
ncbi:hypothetical protein NC653_017866 [Populus alba x Populus x berolinensis]|uniref:3-hydroxyisobutyryl-CoA hydrolase n=1 Tax=Populus alba x Populus x berolinensis TaxID=444605 RepID=A0AAD6QRN9_9ROSI|nr:hypothetical protein NC653_017866 [Populus alba x Populus x berolinensis]